MAALLAVSTAAPIRAASASGRLPQEKLHATYVDGDFDRVESEISIFRGKHKTYGREDSLFIAKYLGVIYSANPATREKGRYYLLQLLELDPNARLVELFVSEEIDRVFDKAREEHAARKKMAFQPRPPMNPGPENGPTKPAPEAKPAAQPAHNGDGAVPRRSTRNPGRRSRAGLYWAAGAGAGLIVTGVAAYHYLGREESPPAEKVYVIQKPAP